MAHADRMALIAQAVAKHQPEHRGRIIECEDCQCDVWQHRRRGGKRRLCRGCSKARELRSMALMFGARPRFDPLFGSAVSYDVRTSTPSGE